MTLRTISGGRLSPLQLELALTVLSFFAAVAPPQSEPGLARFG